MCQLKRDLTGDVVGFFNIINDNYVLKSDRNIIGENSNESLLDIMSYIIFHTVSPQFMWGSGDHA